MPLDATYGDMLVFEASVVWKRDDNLPHLSPVILTTWPSFLQVFIKHANRYIPRFGASRDVRTQYLPAS